MVVASPFIQKLLDRFGSSRYATISFLLHVLLIAGFGGTVLFQAASEPPDFIGAGGDGKFVASSENNTPPPPQNQPAKETSFKVTTDTQQPTTPPLTAITTQSTQALSFTMDAVMSPSMNITPTVDSSVQNMQTTAPKVTAEGLNAQQAKAISEFTGGWSVGKQGSGGGKGDREREFQFIAYIAQYAGGDWNSTITVEKGKVVRGSLPNLLWLISKWSNGKIKTNERDVEVIKLDSDQLFSIKPPFIFMTGTRDFKLTDKEVENLRKYVQLGGCIWGDSSLPGLRSRFDIAFRREMRRIIPDVNKEFEPLPANHDIYTKGYYPEIKSVVPGVNFYKDPVFALTIYGQIGILYTPNDYGDMWQIGLDEKGQIDLSRNKDNQYIAVNYNFWRYNGIYVYNLEPPALANSFKFGTNIIIHLLTRWEDAVRRASRL